MLGTCDFCGLENTELVIEDYHDNIVKHDTIKFGCVDKEACIERKEMLLKLWQISQAQRSTGG